MTCTDHQSVRENLPFVLSCNVTGFPRPNLTFHKDGDEVELRDKLSRQDGGFYTIGASNSQGAVKSQINITVVCKSFFFFFSFSPSIDPAAACLTRSNGRPQTRRRRFPSWRTRW